MNAKMNLKGFVAFDFSNLNLGQDPDVNYFEACKSCDCDHCDYESGSDHYDSSGGCNNS